MPSRSAARLQPIKLHAKTDGHNPLLGATQAIPPRSDDGASRMTVWRRKQGPTFEPLKNNPVLRGCNVPVARETAYPRYANRSSVGERHPDAREILVSPFTLAAFSGKAQRLLAFDLTQPLRAVPAIATDQL